MKVVVRYAGADPSSGVKVVGVRHEPPLPLPE